MGSSPERTEEAKTKMLEALGKSLGIVSTAAKKAGISRETHRLWCLNDPEYAAKVAEVQDDRLDFLESKAHQRVNEGSDTMIIFMLKTQGKKRGYVEKQEVEVTQNLSSEDLDAEILRLQSKMSEGNGPK